MDPLVSTLVVILLALAGSRLSFSTERVPSVARLAFRTGTHFVVIGVLLGPLVLDVLSLEVIDGLSPLIGLALGWIGLLFGLQFDRGSLMRFRPALHVLGLGQALLVFLLFAVAAWFVAGAAGLQGDAMPIVVALVATVASVSTPAGVAAVSANFLVRGRVRRTLFFISSLDASVGILLLHLVFAWAHGTELIPSLGERAPLFWAASGLGLGIVCGILFLWLMRLRRTREELILYLLGISSLCAGAALQLQLSPLLSCTVMGIVVANMAADRDRVYRALQEWDQPVYVLLLILSGALLRIDSWWMLPLVAGYVVLRTAAKAVVVGGLASVLPLGFRAPRDIGLGLVPQGGITIAMALTIWLTFGRGSLGPDGLDLAAPLFALLVMGVLASELVAPFFVTRVLRKAGEIARQVERALAEGDEERARSEAIRHHAPPPPRERADADTV